MVLFGLFRSRREDDRAAGLYSAIVKRARETVFYTHFAVPDTPEGRFDMIALHAFLVLWRLKADHPDTAALAQGLFDHMFADMDQNLREMGVGDLSVGPRVKKMAKAFYGRTAAYESGLDEDEEEMIQALRRNLYGNAAPQPREVTAMARYVRDQASFLKATPLKALLSAEMPFAPAAAHLKIKAN